MNKWTPIHLVLHHSASPASAESIAALDYYHIVVQDSHGPAGPRMLMSVPNDRPSQHAVGHYNSRSWSLCVVGNYELIQPSSLLEPYLVQIFAARMKAYGLRDINKIQDHGYIGRYVVAPGNRYTTQCCGTNLRALLPGIRSGVARYLR